MLTDFLASSHLSLPGIDFGAAARLKVGGDAQVPPLPVGFQPRHITLLRRMNGIASQQQPQRWFSEAGDVDDDGRSLDRIARLGTVMVALVLSQRADGGIVLGCCGSPDRQAVRDYAPWRRVCVLRQAPTRRSLDLSRENSRLSTIPVTLESPLIEPGQKYTIYCLCRSHSQPLAG